MSLLYTVPLKHTYNIIYIIQLSPKGEVNSGGYSIIPGREASRYISTTLHRP